MCWENVGYIPRSRWSGRVTRSFLRTIKDYVKGFLFFGLLEGMETEKRCLDGLFMVDVCGPLLGVPGLFNYYQLRLLPYYVERLGPWKRRVLREKDFFDYITE